MNDDPPNAWMGPWLAARDSLAAAAAGAAIARQLFEFGQDYAGLAAIFWPQSAVAGQAPPGSASWQGTESMQAALADHYRRLFAPTLPPAISALPPQEGAAAAVARCQRAVQALAAEAGTVAADAARRLVAELGRSDAGATPIRTLAGLRALAIECGEAAWAAAVREDAYATAQAEWLAALVELHFELGRLQPPAPSAARPAP